MKGKTTGHKYWMEVKYDSTVWRGNLIARNAFLIITGCDLCYFLIIISNRMELFYSHIKVSVIFFTNLLACNRIQRRISSPSGRQYDFVCQYHNDPLSWTNWVFRMQYLKIILLTCQEIYRLIVRLPNTSFEQFLEFARAANLPQDLLIAGLDLLRFVL